MSKIPQNIFYIVGVRMHMYKFVAEIFKGEPSSKLLYGITQDFFKQYREEKGEENDFMEGYVQICDFVETFSDEKELRELLSREYRDLFGEKIKALERRYITKSDGILHDLRDVYEKRGWTIPEDFPKEEDHIAVECEFVTHLCKGMRKTLLSLNAEESEASFNFQRDFINEHVLNWVPGLCDEIESETENEFYLGASKMTSGILDIDKELLTMFY
ncbi:MAG: molecular chaperone TorD family protein [Methanocellales archaeon]|nr:molecular chaperone TorD family protein [Methanocellales archaeon]MDD3291810.1 molecular chaperone TorD family protein [Methanocellales archaeon]MDD5234576.1 molecular chaperone TorD family protein [Methanocellales archaeon]MDD5485071.1 molecular chaperone TorD family protein [Methanocellales archaeon]